MLSKQQIALLENLIRSVPLYKLSKICLIFSPFGNLPSFNLLNTRLPVQVSIHITDSAIVSITTRTVHVHLERPSCQHWISDAIENEKTNHGHSFILLHHVIKLGCRNSQSRKYWLSAKHQHDSAEPRDAGELGDILSVQWRRMDASMDMPYVLRILRFHKILEFAEVARHA